MRRDDSVTQQRVTKGTARRMIQFARPYRTILAWFLVLVVVEAVIGVINPLLFRLDHRQRASPTTTRP